MSTIEIKSEDNFIIISVNGKLTATRFIETATGNYASGTAKNVIWNLSHGSLKLLSISDLKTSAHAVSMSCKDGIRTSGKTIFVASADEDYSLLCTYNAIIESKRIPIEYHVCRFMADARDWLK